MKILFYSTKAFEKPYYENLADKNLQIDFTDKALSPATVAMARGYAAVSIFTNDDASAPVLKELKHLGVRFVSTRATGHDNIDHHAAERLSIRVANVPGYSPYAIAEHAVAMMLTLNRKLIKADKQVHRYNFSLDNLVGFDLNKKTIGVVGTGTIGEILVNILDGFGCNFLVYDIKENKNLLQKKNLRYVALDELCSKADIISLHLPLSVDTKDLFNKEKFSLMKKGVMIINTARGGVIDTKDLIEFLDNGTIGYCGLDVYENEKGIFFFNHEEKGIEDAMLKKLLSYENVLVTPHQAFATHEALTNISDTTLQTNRYWAEGKVSPNEIT